jgi:hypothetical protein
MKAPEFASRAEFWLRCLQLGVVLALIACGNGVGNPGRDSADASVDVSANVNVSGHLTLKGSQPGAWWAVTDDQGRVWKIASPTPEQVETFQKAQNGRIRIEGRRQAKYLSFEQIQPSRIVVVAP